MARTWEAQTVPLVWEGKRPEIVGIEGKVRSELQNNLEDLSKPSDLIFHIVF